MKKRLRIIIPLLILLIGGIFGYRVYQHQKDDDRLRFSGNIEITEIRMSFRIAGQLVQRQVEEGDTVHKEQLLARLDDSDQMVGLARAEAGRDYAAAVLAELENGSRPEDISKAVAKVAQVRQALTELQNGSRSEEIESSRAEQESADAARDAAQIKLRQAKIDHERYNALYKEGSVSKNVFEVYQTQYDTVKNEVKEAEARFKRTTEQFRLLKAGPRIEQIRQSEAALQQAEAEYSLIKAGARQEVIEQARAKLQLAEQDVQQAANLLGYTRLHSPGAGVVMSTSAEAGEYLNPATPVLTIGRSDAPWLRAYVTERMLGRIKLGDTVSVRTDSYPDKSYSGTVSYIGSQAEFTPKTVQTFEERVKLMYRIKVRLDDPDRELKPGMPADGELSLQ